MKKKVGIIGTGISGMSAAYFLKDDYEITVFEKNDYIGGHTNTISFDHDGEKVSLDTGFMVFNEVTYPNLLKLFKELEIPYENTSMSFSVHHKPSAIEYNGSSINGLFAQRKNVFNPSHINMLLNINKFNQKSPQILEGDTYNDMTVEEFVKDWNLGEAFLERFLIPMSSAVWSSPPDRVRKFPIKTLVRFFFNHGFMGLNTQHQWKTVIGRSESYKQALIESFREEIKVGEGAKKITQFEDKVLVETNKGKYEFDFIVMASHADQSLRMIENPTEDQLKYLSAFKYQKNIATVHTDSKVMPRLKSNWSAWNYITEKSGETYTVYYMNELQRVSTKNDFFININGEGNVDLDKIISVIEYEHPLFDVEAIESQKFIPMLNKGRVKFCGAWTRYGFHEDGLLSSVNLCSEILGRDVL